MLIKAGGRSSRLHTFCFHLILPLDRRKRQSVIRSRLFPVDMVLLRNPDPLATSEQKQLLNRGLWDEDTNLFSMLMK